MYVYPFRHLVLSGGGVRGCGYARLWSVLEREKIAPRIRRIAGVSAGSIVAGLIGLGFKGSEIEEIVKNMKFGDFADNSWGIVRDFYRLLTKFGWNKGEVFLAWYGDLIRKKYGNADFTLLEAYHATGIDLTVNATCLETQTARAFNYASDPNLPVRMAVRMSISIPVFFTAVEYQGHTYVDGGVVDNYPIWMFDAFDSEDPRHASNETGKHCHTIGFRLIGEPAPPTPGTLAPLMSVWRWIAGYKAGIDGLNTYLSSLVSTMCKTIETAAVRNGYWERTVVIDTDQMGSIDFNPSPELVQLVTENGERALVEYLEEFREQYPQTAGRYLDDFSRPGVPVAPRKLTRTKTWPHITFAAVTADGAAAAAREV
jgi:NTE family protein